MSPLFGHHAGAGSGRTIQMDAHRMTYRLDMAAVGRPLVFHLEASLERVAAPG